MSEVLAPHLGNRRGGGHCAAFFRSLLSAAVFAHSFAKPFKPRCHRVGNGLNTLTLSSQQLLRQTARKIAALKAGLDDGNASNGTLVLRSGDQGRIDP
jgi:hypothetical protein